jgi:serine/threonine-protein kinase PknG
MRCPHPGCPGSIDESQFCDTCGRRAPESTPEVGTFRVAGLVDMPVRNFPHPERRITTSLPSGTLTLACPTPGCNTPLGGSYAGQPALTKGYCLNCGTPFSFEPQLAAGDLVADQYEVVGPLGRGGMGWVYLAKDKHLDDNYVALKGIINTNDQHAIRVAISERRFLTSIDHPTIVRIFNFVQLGDAQDTRTGYIVMEYLNGASLEEIGPEGLPLEQILGYGHEILAALQYLHSRGLLYCDIKPDNVMRTANRVKLIDLGGVRPVDATTPPMLTRGFYDPAEMREGRPSERSDLYAVGMTLATLRRWSGPARDASLGLAVESFDHLVKRATVPWPHVERRFASAAEMIEQLTGVLREVQSLRLDREHPERSTVFARTAVLLDGRLGSPPPLRLWLARRGAHGLPPCRLESESVAIGLPVPLPHPDDPNADVLSILSAPDPEGLIRQVSAIGNQSVDSHLTLCRARLGLSDVDAAEECLARASTMAVIRTAHDWRIRWHRGLLALARGEVGAAGDAFKDVYRALPGELAAKLALGACAELAGQWDRAEQYYALAWRCDRAQVNAAFGLARVHLLQGRRNAAIGVLDEVPRVSRHYPAARVAAVQALFRDVADPPDRPPTAEDLDMARDRLRKLQVTEATRERLAAALCEVELAWFERGHRTAPPGQAARERELRSRMEQALRALAGHARNARAHGALIDMANSVRPRTLW